MKDPQAHINDLFDQVKSLQKEIELKNLVIQLRDKQIVELFELIEKFSQNAALAANNAALQEALGDHT